MGDQGPIVPTSAAEEPIDPGTRIGHVHLRTSDIDRIRDFYVGVLGSTSSRRRATCHGPRRATRRWSSGIRSTSTGCCASSTAD